MLCHLLPREKSIIKEINKLKNFQHSLEKSTESLNFLSKHGTEDDLCGFLANLEKTRKIEFNKIHHELGEILKSLDEKKLIFKNKNADDIILDPKTFKKDMIYLQDAIQNFKLKLKNDNEYLKDQEKELTDELKLFDKKIDEWKNKPLKYFHVTFKINRENSQTNDNNSSTMRENNRKEVKRFMDFLNKNDGHENGWASEDHQLFLKMRQKYKDTATVAHHLHKLLPDISEEDVNNHEIWYCQYTEFRNKIKEAINNWKASKIENSPNNLPDQIQNDRVAASKNKKNYLKVHSKQKIVQWKAEKEAKRRQEIELELLEKQRQRELQQNRKKNEE